MPTKVEIFRKLHYAEEPLFLGNVWNVQSAKVFEKIGLKAVGTSSAAVARSIGYEDGENMPFDEYLYIIERISKSISLPLSVDIEGGYGQDSYSVFKNIVKLHNLGVAGINIEDSHVKDGTRAFIDSQIFIDRIGKILEYIKESGIDIFINVRCDAFLLQLPDALEKAKGKIKLLEELKIDGIFLPRLSSITDIREIVQFTGFPINVMSVPALPDIDTLRSLNVKRISTGDFLYEHVYNQLEQTAGKILKEKSFSILF